jgi:hypothetical protein
MSNKQGAKESGDEYAPQYRNMPLYVILFCGLIISFIGLYLLITNQISVGRSQPGRFGGAGGQSQIINGPFTLFIGLIICVFPAWQLFKQEIGKRRRTKS